MGPTGVLVVVISSVFLSTATSSQQKPNFSGRWVVLSPADSAGQEQVVKHDASALSIEHPSAGGSHGAIYKLDGTESRNVITSHGSDIVTLSKATWTGNQLTIASVTTYPDGRRLEQKQVWSLDSEGRLIIEVTALTQGQSPTTVRLVHRKAGA